MSNLKNKEESVKIYVKELGIAIQNITKDIDSRDITFNFKMKAINAIHERAMEAIDSLKE